MSDSNKFEGADFLSALIDNLPLAVFCKDYSSGIGKFVAWNSTAENLWGLKKDDVLGKSDFDFFPEDQAGYFKQKDLDTLKNGGIQFTNEENVDSPTVGRRIVRTWKVPVKERFLLGVSQDITEQKTMEETLEKQKVAMINTSKLASLGEMAGGLAHEINNPLAVIKASNENLRMLLQKVNDPNVTKSIDTIDNTIDRISLITSGLLNFARVDKRIEKESVEIKKVINETMKFCEASIRSKSIDLEVSIEHDDVVRCNPVEISQVFINCLNNSVDAVKKEKKPWIKMKTLKEGGRLGVEISNSGPKIEGSVAEKIFQPFYTTKSEESGTGLGLSICKGIMEDHNGTIEVDLSKKNTTFLIWFNK